MKPVVITNTIDDPIHLLNRSKARITAKVTYLALLRLLHIGAEP